MLKIITAFMLFFTVFIPVSAKSAPVQGIDLDIIMYHSVCTDEDRSGNYVLTPARLESDMQYLVAHGYTAVLPQQLVQYTKGELTLPQKCVMLTFDDGQYNNLTYVLPLLKKYGLKAVISVVGEYADAEENEQYRSPAYSYLLWDEIAALADSGYTEIGNHTYAMHRLRPRKGCARKKNEPLDSYKAALRADLTAMQSKLLNKCGIAPVCFTYPFGETCPCAEEVVRQCGFLVSLSCTEGKNRISNAEDLYLLKRYNRSGKISTQEFMKKAGIM